MICLKVFPTYSCLLEFPLPVNIVRFDMGFMLNLRFRHFGIQISVSLGQSLACINIHSFGWTSSTVSEEDIGCNDVSLHKLELGDSLSVVFPGNKIGI